MQLRSFAINAVQSIYTASLTPLPALENNFQIFSNTYFWKY